MCLFLTGLFATACFANPAQIKGGEWEVVGVFEASGIEQSVGESLARGPILASGEETVFAKWRDHAHPNGPVVFGLLLSPSMAIRWTYGPLQGWSSEFAATVVPDFDQDGIDDILVGMAVGDGLLWLLDGATGTLLWSTQGPPNSRLGHSVSIVSDLNSDSKDDWAVIAQNEYGPGATDAGRIYLYSGSDGSLIRILDPPDPWNGHLATLADAGDWNGDGVGDLFCYDGGSGFYTGSGLHVRNGLDGTILQSWVSPTPPPHSLLAMDDMDGDGKPEAVAGHSGADSSNGIQSAGIVRLYLSTGSGPEWEAEGSKPMENLGAFLSMTPDLDLDGIPDLAASAHVVAVNGVKEVGFARLLSSRTGERLRRLTGDKAYERFSSGLVGLGTAEQPLLCVGSPVWEPPGTTQPLGRIQCLQLNRQLWATPAEITASQGGTVHFEIDFPAEFAGEYCFPIASRLGIDRSELLGINLSLTRGPLFTMGITTGYPFLLAQTITLDSEGDWQFDFKLPANSRVTAALDLYVVVFRTPTTFQPGEGGVSYPLRIRILP